MVVVTVCVGSSCYVRGSHRVAEALERLIQQHSLEGRVEINGAFCMERCSLGVTVRVDDQVFSQVMPDEVEAFFKHNVLPRGQVG
jgi:NADH:ubiquinone oxidoreductase subunit E